MGLLSRYIYIKGRASLSIRDPSVLANLISIWILLSTSWHHIRYGHNIEMALGHSAVRAELRRKNLQTNSI